MLRPEQISFDEFDRFDIDDRFDERMLFENSNDVDCGCQHQNKKKCQVTLDCEYDCCKPKPCPKPCPKPKPCPRPTPEPTPDTSLETPNCAGQVLGMAYVPNQRFSRRRLFSVCNALERGTLFVDLYKPFEGGES